MPRTSTRSRIPSYRCHKPSGRAVVTLNGTDHYLGPYESAISKAEYDRLIGEWLANGRRLSLPDNECQASTINEVIAAFWSHAQGYYRRSDGTPTSEQGNLKQILKHLARLYGHTSAQDFGPVSLKALRQHLIDVGRCRTSINRDIGRVKQVFRWAVAQEMIPAYIYHGLQTVSGLKRGRSNAKESAPVSPVAQAHIDAVLPHLSRQLKAVVRLQLLTGARPGEILAIRPVDIDVTGRIWTYTPPQHKTEHHGHRRTIYLGPRAQAVVEPFLAKRSVDSYLFCPAEAEAERSSRRHTRRITPLSCGNRPGTNRKRNPKREPGQCYTTSSYRRAIHRACDAAGVPRWHPHRLRHSAATELRKEFGIEAARIILGHRSAAITEVYAELDRNKAIEIMEAVG